MKRRWIAAVGVLVVAAGAVLGTAYAGGRHSAVKHLKGTTFAVVKADGTLVRHGKHVLQVVPAGAQYEIYYDSDVTGCAFTATIGDPATGGFPTGQISVESSTTTTRSWVATFDSGGTLSPKPFHLIVVC
jgi:hypothetical protein